MSGDKIINCLFNPFFKAFTYFINTILVSILCGALVNENTINGVVQWDSLFKSYLLKWLVVIVILAFIYYLVAAVNESKINKKHKEMLKRKGEFSEIRHKARVDYASKMSIMMNAGTSFEEVKNHFERLEANCMRWENENSIQ